MAVYTLYDRILVSRGLANMGSISAPDYNGSDWDNTATASNIASWLSSAHITITDIGMSAAFALAAAMSGSGSYQLIMKLKNGIGIYCKVDRPTLSFGIYLSTDGEHFEESMGFSGGIMNFAFSAGSYNVKKFLLFFIVRNGTIKGILYDMVITCGNTDYRCVRIRTDTYTDDLVTRIFTGQPLNIDDPYVTDDNKTEPGGYGPYDYTSETETPPQLPAISAAQVGFVSLWNPTQAEMKSLASYLWTGTFDLTNFKKLFTDPMECVLAVGIIPITPTRESSKREIVFGGSSHSGVNAYPVTEQFYIVDMGTLHIGGMSNGALDYSPYAKASIYLPYCGTYALDVDEIMDSDISLEYHIDIYTGACVAYLTIDGHLNSDGHNVNAIMYQFTGNVLASIPITGNDHSQFIQSMLFMGAAAAATVATSGAGAGAAAGAGADLGAETAATGFNKALAGSAVNTVMSMKPNVLHSGNLSTTAGMLGGQKPFITMTWSNLCRPEDENKLIGMPLHKSGTLSDFQGFTIVSACHLNNILCTDAELQMIEQALAKGVIL